ncbi:hypothetical protein B6S12_10435, partial [Helicobacter valdiviensis]
MQKILMVLGFFLILSISINAQSPEEAKPSFDCAKATTEVEKMICGDGRGILQNLDRYMSEVYTQLRKELKISKFPNKEQRLKELLESQRAFIKNLNEVDETNFKYAYDEAYEEHIYFTEDAYEDRITHLLKLLGEVLDSNNKELCEYARSYKIDWSKWQEVPPSVNPPFSIGFCAFGASERSIIYPEYCTKKGEFKKTIKDFNEGYPFVFKRKIDINNDGVLDNVILSNGQYFDALAIYKNGKLDAKASDKIYGDDLHFSGSGTFNYLIGGLDEAAAMAFGAYAMPSNKISQRLEFDYDHPILSYLSYGV